MIKKDLWDLEDLFQELKLEDTSGRCAKILQQISMLRDKKDIGPIMEKLKMLITGGTKETVTKQRLRDFLTDQYGCIFEESEQARRKNGEERE